MTASALTPHQQTALRTIMDVWHGVTVNHQLAFQLALLTGPAGSGKTTTLRAVIDLAEKDGSVQLLAPTGKAAHRAAQVTGRTATTIHRWLYQMDMDLFRATGEVRFIRREEDTLNIPSSGLVIVDEWSMVGNDVMTDLFETAEEHNLTVLGVGDPFQLPPVNQREGDPTPFDLPVSAHAKLTEVVRQALDSPIIRAATFVRDGAVDRGLSQLTEVAQPRIVEIASKVCAGPSGAVLVHRNASRQQLNVMIRETFGWAGLPLQRGERIMCLKNDYLLGVMNGQTLLFEGFLTPMTQVAVAVPKFSKKPGGMHTFVGALVDGMKVVICLEVLLGVETADYQQLAEAAEDFATDYKYGRSYTTAYETTDARIETVQRFVPAPYLHAVLGWAVTTHKMQGSEADDVLFMLEPSVRLHEEDGRRWLYTAITRAKVQCRYARWPWQLKPSPTRVEYVPKIPTRLLVIGCGGATAPIARTVEARVAAAGGLAEAVGTSSVDDVHDHVGACEVLDQHPSISAVVLFEPHTPSETDKVRSRAYAMAAKSRGVLVYLQRGESSMSILSEVPRG